MLELAEPHRAAVVERDFLMSAGKADLAAFALEHVADAFGQRLLELRPRSAVILVITDHVVGRDEPVLFATRDDDAGVGDDASVFGLARNDPVFLLQRQKLRRVAI